MFVRGVYRPVVQNPAKIWTFRIFGILGDFWFGGRGLNMISSVFFIHNMYI